MKKMKSTNIADVSDELIEGLQLEDVADKNVTVLISERDKISVKDEYVMLFATNLQTLLVKNKLNLTELKVLMTVVKFTQFKNVFNVTQTVIANDANMDKANVSRVMKSLRKKGLILHDEKTGVDFLNPYLFLKGSIKEFKASPIAEQLRFEGFDMDEDIKNPY